MAKSLPVVFSKSGFVGLSSRTGEILFLNFYDDTFIVNGSAKLVGWISSITRLFQTGYVYHYAFTMIIGVFVLMTLWINRA